MFYHIDMGVPNRGELSGYGFIIKLSPKWKEAVARDGLAQENVHAVIPRMGHCWLDNCGFEMMFDSNESPFEKRKSWGQTQAPFISQALISGSSGENGGRNT